MKRDISKEAMRYIAVGAVGYVIDTGLFNVLSLFADLGFGDYNPLANKTVSSLIAIAVTYVGNSRWTFRHRTGRPEGIGRVARYGVVNLIGFGIGIASLGVSRYIFGFESLIADNISANVIGVCLALVFRFLANRYWVFKKAI
jgi:putative flippase GtrA